jgi:hypothetical protein
MPVVTYVDPDSVHNPSSGGIAPASWFTTHEANFRSITGRVGCKIRNSTNQTLTANGGTQAVTLGTIEYNNGMTTSTANAIVVPTSYAGKYLISANCRIDFTTASIVTDVILVRVNGTTVHEEKVSQSTGSPVSGVVTTACTFLYALSVADAVTLAVSPVGHSGADSYIEQTTNAFASLSCIWLSA